MHENIGASISCDFTQIIIIIILLVWYIFKLLFICKLFSEIMQYSIEPSIKMQSNSSSLVKFIFHEFF